MMEHDRVPVVFGQPGQRLREDRLVQDGVGRGTPCRCPGRRAALPAQDVSGRRVQPSGARAERSPGARGSQADGDRRGDETGAAAGTCPAPGRTAWVPPDRERAVVPLDQGSRPVVELLERRSVARLIPAHQVPQDPVVLFGTRLSHVPGEQRRAGNVCERSGKVQSKPEPIASMSGSSLPPALRHAIAGSLEPGDADRVADAARGLLRDRVRRTSRTRAAVLGHEPPVPAAGAPGSRVGVADGDRRARVDRRHSRVDAGTTAGSAATGRRAARRRPRPGLLDSWLVRRRTLEPATPPRRMGASCLPLA